MIPITILALPLLWSGVFNEPAEVGPPPPNVVIIFTDDQGYGDVGVYGAEGFETPHLDRMAAEGMRFTDFYVAQPVCSASRAGLLTGCYPNRIGITGALGPGARHGIHDDEVTLGELCKSKGYATAVFGKWHLGHRPQFLPPRHGFDEYLGTPYSNDMWPLHPDLVHLPEGAAARKRRYPDLPLIEGDTVVDAKVTSEDQRTFTTRFTERAVAFIERNRGRPFFLYVAHPMPHVPLHVSDKFQGATEQGLYGDVIAEIDWSVGEILTAIRENGIDERTLVIFTSDNGPWLSYGDHAGSPGPLREGKGTTFEGGVRVPCIMRWPGRIPPGRVCAEPVMTIDIFPTVAELIGAPLPDHVIDGKSILTLMTAADGVRSPHEALFFYYHRNDLEAMRSGRWKLHFPHRYRSMEGREPGRGGTPGKYDYSRRTGLELYDLSADIGESKNVADAHPDVVERLVRLAEAMRADLGDALTNTAPTGAREPGRLAPARVDEPEGATKHEGDGSATAALSYRWVVVSDGVVDLMDGDQRVLRYMHAYDASTPERLHETYKCYHHVFDARGEHVLTKGPGGLYTHHRGLFIGWNRLTVDGREYDFWHMKGVTQRHAGMLELLAGPEAARQTALIHWCDGEDKIVIAERRTVRVTRGGDGAMLVIGFRSELTAERDDVLLLGDPEHAGFQFRAHNDVAEGPPEVKAKYLFHEKDVDPRKETDLPWAVMSFGLNGKRYWVQHMNHPRNPSPTVYSAYRDYGRFGAYPRTEIEAGETLILRYRLRIGEGDAPTRRALAQSYETYRQASAASSGATGGDGR